MKSEEILVVPDIHGRKFWKEGNPNVYTKDYKLIVFLGDYLDPYYDEHISLEDCIANFEEIIKFKSDNNLKVVLLLGNHDLHYLSNQMMESSRKYPDKDSKIYNLFRNNSGLFKVMHTEKVDDRNIVFSHAPIVMDWAETCNNVLSMLSSGIYRVPTKIEEMVNFLNNLWVDYNNFGNPRLFGLMSYCSWYRGGYDRSGSPVWADVREARKIEDWYQVFGHTQLSLDECLKGDGYVDADCRRCFPLNELL